MIFYKAFRQNKESLFSQKISPRYMSFEITVPDCDRLKKMALFFEKFNFPHETKLSELKSKHPENLLYFTNNMDPYDTYHQRLMTGHGKVGGGCAPYAMSLIKEAGYYTKTFEKFRLNINVSDILRGGTLDPSNGNVRKVPVKDLLFLSLGNSWEYSNTPSKKLDVFDPQKIWDFIGDVNGCLVSQGKTCSLIATEFLENSRYQALQGDPHVYTDVRSFDKFTINDTYPNEPVLEKNSVSIQGIKIQRK